MVNRTNYYGVKLKHKAGAHSMLRDNPVVNLRMNRKGAAELLLEIILSTVIFFVIIVFIFAIKVPQLEFTARATIVSSDAALACETSLTNLLRTERDDVTIAQFMADSFILDKMSDIPPPIERIFNKAFSQGRWEMNVSLPNGTTILNISKVQQGQFPFSCTSYIPLHAEYNEKICFYTETQGKFDGETAEFQTPEGAAVSCRIIDNEKLGIVPDRNTCNLNTQVTSVFEEPPESTITNDLQFADTLTLPILVGKANYELALEENSDELGNELQGVAVTLTRRALIQDCSLAVTLTTTNISAAF